MTRRRTEKASTARRGPEPPPSWAPIPVCRAGEAGPSVRSCPGGSTGDCAVGFATEGSSRACASLPWLVSIPGDRPSPSAGADGAAEAVHVVSATTVDGPDGPVLRVVVTWAAAGKRTETTVEVAECRTPERANGSAEAPTRLGPPDVAPSHGPSAGPLFGLR